MRSDVTLAARRVCPWWAALLHALGLLSMDALIERARDVIAGLSVEERAALRLHVERLRDQGGIGEAALWIALSE